MFKIGEFSKLTQISVRMLRYYDAAGLLSPARIDPDTGYRLYSAGQIPVLNQIIFLRDAGFGVAEIIDIMKNWNEAYIKERLNQKQLDIQEALLAEQDKLARITQAMNDMERGTAAPKCDVIVKSIPSYQVISLRKVIADYYAEGLLWKEMAAYIQQKNICVSPQTFSIYHDSEYKETEVDVELCALTTDTGPEECPFSFRQTEAVALMASSFVYGSFYNIAAAYRSFAGWLDGHSQYQMEGPSRQIVHKGPWNETDEAHFLTEIQIPVIRKPRIN